ncbi:MAG: L,D-transpeptidase family protein [Candidatus Geothermincolia bacterium]
MKAVGLPARSMGWLGEKKLSRVMLIVGAILLVALVVGLLGYLFVQDVLSFGKFPQGVRVVGVSVAGLNQSEAIEKVRAELAPVANRPLTLKVDEEKYQISPQELGLMLDYKKMVEEGYQKAWSVNIFERMARRFINRPRPVSVSILADNNPERVQGFLSTIINSINRHPRDAYVDVTSGRPVIVKAQDGRNTPMDQLQKDTDAALMTPSRTVNVKVGRTPAGLTDAVIGKMIIVTVAESKLRLYNREQQLIEFPVACGSPSYPSPAGAWKIVEKQRNPSWSNPGSAWAASMPPYIAPGPGNPLGTRALALSASGVLIHGTPSSWSIGSNVSHGCIRMYMKDVEQLFEMVEAGTPVYIIKAAGDPGFDVRDKVQ